MRRALVLAALAAPAGAARAETEPPAPESTAASEAESFAGAELSGAIGAELGGRVTPGGLHLAGAFLYQLSDQDWFDGGLAFTFGSGQEACFRDRGGDTVCDHGVVDGFGAEAAAGVRRYFPGQAAFTPYARAALALRWVRYGGDGVGGLAIPLELGGGVRAPVTDRIWLAGGAEVRLGPAWFNRDLGSEPHIGLAVHAAAEFRL
jgi:hypothetical protein